MQPLFRLGHVCAAFARLLLEGAAILVQLLAALDAGFLEQGLRPPAGVFEQALGIAARRFEHAAAGGALPQRDDQPGNGDERGAAGGSQKVGRFHVTPFGARGRQNEGNARCGGARWRHRRAAPK